MNILNSFNLYSGILVNQVNSVLCIISFIVLISHKETVTKYVLKALTKQ
jgi:hypothetical protein